MASEFSNGDGSSNAVHFFKIMLQDTLLQGKLRIPAKFVSKYGEQLSNTMFLKLPNGAKWKVNLVKRDGNVWFQKGWKEFEEYYSLAHGHLLFFRFDGTSNFHVNICDMSTMEIDYPDIKGNHKRSRINSEEIHQKRQKTKENKKLCTSNLEDRVIQQKIRDLKGKEKIEGSSNCNFGALEASGNISFTVIIDSKYLKKRHMYVPQGAGRGNFKLGEQYATLLVGDKSWRVKVSNYIRSGCFFTGNWAIFAKDNDLKAGDTCLFQLMNNNGDEIVIKVSISRRQLVLKC